MRRTDAGMGEDTSINEGEKWNTHVGTQRRRTQACRHNTHTGHGHNDTTHTDTYAETERERDTDHTEAHGVGTRARLQVTLAVVYWSSCALLSQALALFSFGVLCWSLGLKAVNLSSISLILPVRSALLLSTFLTLSSRLVS